MKLCLSAVFLITLAFSWSCDSPRFQFAWKELTNDFHGVSIEVPPSWSEDGVRPGTILSARSTEKSASFRPNVNVIAESRPPKESSPQALDRISKMVPTQLQLILANYRLLDQKRREVSGHEAIEFKGTYEGREGWRMVHTVIVLAPRTIYTLTTTHSDRDDEGLESTLAAVRNSLTIRSK